MDILLAVIIGFTIGFFGRDIARRIRLWTYDSRFWYVCTACGWQSRNLGFMRLHATIRRHRAVRYSGIRR